MLTCYYFCRGAKPKVGGYDYASRELAEAKCQSEGYQGLCSKAEVEGQAAFQTGKTQRLFPTCQVRLVRFLFLWIVFSSSSAPDLNRKIAVGSYWTSQWAEPDLNCKRQSSAGSTGPQQQSPHHKHNHKQSHPQAQPQTRPQTCNHKHAIASTQPQTQTQHTTTITHPQTQKHSHNNDLRTRI